MHDKSSSFMNCIVFHCVFLSNVDRAVEYTSGVNGHGGKLKISNVLRISDTKTVSFNRNRG